MNRVKLDPAAAKLIAQTSRPENERPSADNTTTSTVSSLNGDEVKLSDRATRVQTAVDKIHELPAARQERVSALRAQVQAGTYRPSGQEIADAILRDEHS